MRFRLEPRVSRALASAALVVAGVVLSTGCKDDCNDAVANLRRIADGEKGQDVKQRLGTTTDEALLAECERAEQRYAGNTYCVANARNAADVKKCF